MGGRSSARAATAIVIDVASTELARAIQNALSGAEHACVDSRRGLLVTDTPFPVRPAIVVVESLPAACDAALEQLESGDHVRGIVCADELPLLAAVVRSVESGLLACTPKVRVLGRRAPCLSDRQTAVVRAMLAGYRNLEIATELDLSEATVKRDIAFVGRALGCGPSRAAIAAAACALGFVATEVERSPAAHRHASRG